MKKIIILIIVLLNICIIGCETKKDKLEWNNEEAIYVSIKQQYRNEIYKDIEVYFSNYNYAKIYVVDKYADENGYINYRLLFIVKSNVETFCEKLKEDDRISSFEICKDLPYDSFDNRYIYIDKEEVFVGDTITISIEGDCDIYMQGFYYDSIIIKPINYDSNNDYDANYFKEIKNVNAVIKKNDSLLLLIDNSSYFGLIKTIDKLSRSPLYQVVEFNYIYVIHPIWEIIDDNNVSYIINQDNSLTLTALKAGSVIIKYDGIERTIKIGE